jgi:hypothetical protein
MNRTTAAIRQGRFIPENSKQEGRCPKLRAGFGCAHNRRTT